MPNGFSYLLGEVAVLAIAAAVLGLLCGRFLWPRRVVEPAYAQPPPPLSATQDLEPALSGLEQRLRASESEVDQLRLAVAQVADHKDAEMGRLESGAIRALDSVILTHREQIDALQDQLEAATAAAHEHAEVLAAERLLNQRLRAALGGRDERIAALARQLNGDASPIPGDGRDPGIG
ncbi:MAG: hypothetical protein WAL50_21900 [Kineosporiaceae bacterium]